MLQQSSRLGANLIDIKPEKKFKASEFFKNKSNSFENIDTKVPFFCKPHIKKFPTVNEIALT